MSQSNFYVADKREEPLSLGLAESWVALTAQLAAVTAERDRMRKLLDALIEEHAPHKFGPCVCDLCKEYAALAQPAAAQPTEGE